MFLEGVLQPSLERGRLGALQGLLEKVDPGLERCGRYLMASCHFLQRRGYFHTLYQLQQFMMVGLLITCRRLGFVFFCFFNVSQFSIAQDHVRAAMTCIRFFTHGATSYIQLGEQQVLLLPPSLTHSLTHFYVLSPT